MQKEVVLSVVQAATKGANIKVSWHRPCKTKKTCTDTITKMVHAVGRVGINYDNQAIVKQLRESGELPEQSQPIWHGVGEWAVFPYLIRHTKTDQHYLRLYVGTGTATPKVQFFKNGIPVNFEEIESSLLASEKNKEHGLCFCCKVEDMTEISWNPAPPHVERENEREAIEETETAAVPV